MWSRENYVEAVAGLICGVFRLDCRPMPEKDEATGEKRRRPRQPRRRPARNRETDKPGPQGGEATVKVACDSMLGKLSRELRALGIDASYSRVLHGMRAYHKARSQGKTFITRNTRLRDLPGVLLLEESDPSKQIDLVKKEIDIGPAGALSRCLECNQPLERISRDQARPSVPFFIYQIHHDFRRCPKCKRVYWPGSHEKGMKKKEESRPRGPSRGRGGRPGRRQTKTGSGAQEKTPSEQDR